MGGEMIAYIAASSYFTVFIINFNWNLYSFQ